MVLSDSVWKHIPSSGASTFARRGARVRASFKMRKGAFADGPDVTVAVRRLTFCGASRRIGSSGEEVARLRARRPLRRSREVRGVSAGVLGRRKPVMVAGGSPRV